MNDQEPLELRGLGVLLLDALAATIAALGVADPWAFTWEAAGFIVIGVIAFVVQVVDLLRPSPSPDATHPPTHRSDR